MTALTSHITICICTFRRREMLQSLLEDLREQETGGLFTYSVLVVDNDRQGSAEQVVSEFRAQQSFRVDYFIEPRQNIALARNKAIENAIGDYVVFIDDDESPRLVTSSTPMELLVRYTRASMNHHPTGW
jgi:succinoglycan biosynthesis protein ExoM